MEEWNVRENEQINNEQRKEQINGSIDMARDIYLVNR